MDNTFINGEIVAILILLELTLQLNTMQDMGALMARRNPYFIGINSAIRFSVSVY